MMNPMEMNMTQGRRKTSLVLPILVGCSAFAIGAVLTFGYVQWQSQKQQLAQMTQMLQVMQTGQMQQTVTRSAAPDLLTVAQPRAEVTQPAPTQQVAAAPAPAPKAQAETDDMAKTTAERIRDLVARSSDPLVSNALAEDVARRETMSIAIQGVNELVEAAVAGRYTLTSNKAGSTGTGRLSIAFTGQEELQAELESLLSSAAAADMISFKDSVRSSDGSFNGQILLYDLVERALLNGNEEERAVGNRISQEARALLATDGVKLGEATSGSGQRVYTVEKGDSLAYIALQFYGQTNDYRRIFEANRDKLSSPERIQIGQRLVIPNLG